MEEGMRKYEVAYQIGEDQTIHNGFVDAPNISEAKRIFEEENPIEGMVILCVIRC